MSPVSQYFILKQQYKPWKFWKLHLEKINKQKDYSSTILAKLGYKNIPCSNLETGLKRALFSISTKSWVDKKYLLLLKKVGKNVTLNMADKEYSEIKLHKKRERKNWSFFANIENEELQTLLPNWHPYLTNMSFRVLLKFQVSYFQLQLLSLRFL